MSRCLYQTGQGRLCHQNKSRLPDPQSFLLYDTYPLTMWTTSRQASGCDPSFCLGHDKWSRSMFKSSPCLCKNKGEGFRDGISLKPYLSVSGSRGPLFKVRCLNRAFLGLLPQGTQRCSVYLVTSRTCFPCPNHPTSPAATASMATYLQYLDLS
jgi:hypothetical protein